MDVKTKNDLTVSTIFQDKYGDTILFLSPDHQQNPIYNGPLARYVKLRVRMRRECLERFPRHYR